MVASKRLFCSVNVPNPRLVDVLKAHPLPQRGEQEQQQDINIVTVVSSTRSKRCHIGLVLPLCSCYSIHLVSIDKFDTISTNQPTTWQMGSALVNYWHARLVCFSFSKLRNPPPHGAFQSTSMHNVRYLLSVAE